MARASKKRIGPGAQGKGDGAGANTEIPKDRIEENAVLSNRDKAQHSRERGLDSRQTRNEQLQDQPANRMDDA
jgi:hypothetical protein